MPLARQLAVLGSSALGPGRWSIGRAYFTLGLHQSAVPRIKQALELRRANLPADNPDAAAAIIWLARNRPRRVTGGLPSALRALANR